MMDSKILSEQINREIIIDIIEKTKDTKQDMVRISFLFNLVCNNALCNNALCNNGYYNAKAWEELKLLLCKNGINV